MTRRRSRFRSFRGGSALLAIILGTAIGVPIIVTQIQGGGGGSVPPGIANLWVDLTGGSCTPHAVAAAYVDAQACGTGQAAYLVAQPGQTVQFANGQFPPQTISFDASKTSTAVTFRGSGSTILGAHTTTTADINMITGSTIPVASTDGFVGPPFKVRVGRSLYSCGGSDATDFTNCVAGPTCGAPPSGSGQLCGWLSGADVVDNSGLYGGGLNIDGASNLVFQNIQNVQGFEEGGAQTISNVTLDNVNARFGDFGGNGLTWINSDDIGNYNGSYALQVHGTNLTFRDDTIHNLTLSNCGGSVTGNDTNIYCHGDGVFMSCSTNVMFDRVQFQNNSVFHIFGSHGNCATPFSSVGGNPGPITIQNTSFGTLDSPSAAVSLRGDTNDVMTGYTFQNNSSVQGWNVGVNSGKTNVTITGWVVRNNVGVNVPCSTPAGATTYSVTDTYNITTSAACSSGSSPVANNNVGGVTLAPLWADSPAGNLDLVLGTIAAHAGDPANCLPVDIHSATRTLPCTIGADEAPGNGSGGSGLASGLSVKTSVTSGGQTRKYRAYAPASCASSGCPLVVFLNGSISGSCQTSTKTSFDLLMDCDLGTNTTSGTAQMGQSTWATEADTIGAVVLFLEGAPNTCFWNTATASMGVCTGWFGLTSDDGQFISDAIQQVETSNSVGANIDTSKVYLTGFSGGGSATSWVSCGSMQGANRNSNSNYKTPQSLFAGFGMWAAGQLGTANVEGVSPACSWPTTGKPTIFVTSKGDATATYEPPPSRQTFACSTQGAGQQCFVRTTTTAADYLAQWGCTAATLVTTSSGATQRDKRTYDPCSVPGAAFEWDSFGASQSVGPAHGMTNYNTVTNVPAMMWQFWSSH